MPYYEYKCLSCEQIFEIEHDMHDYYEHLNCPYCEKLYAVEKLISLSSFRLNWSTTPHPGTKVPVKEINGQVYDEKSYNIAKSCGRFNKK